MISKRGWHYPKTSASADWGLMGTTLRYPYEVRNSKDYFYDIPDVKVAPDMLELAEYILSSKEPVRREDRAHERRRNQASALGILQKALGPEHPAV